MAINTNKTMPAMPDGTPQGMLERLGVYAPSQKRALAQQQQIQQMQQMQQMAMYQRQVQAQEENNRMEQASMGINLPVYQAMKGGEAAGGLLGGLINKFRNKGQPQPVEAPQSGMTERVEQRKYERLGDKMKLPAGQYDDPDEKRLELAKQLLSHPDPYFREEGAKIVEGLRAKVLERRKKEADIAQSEASTAASQAGMLEPKKIEVKEGDEYVTYEQTYNPATKKWERKRIASGNPTQKTSTTGPLTKSDASGQFKDFGEAAKFRMRAKESLGVIASNIRDGAATGWGAKGVRLIDNAIGAFKQLRATMGVKLEKDAEEYANEFMAKGGFRKLAELTGINASRWMEVAYMQAKADNPTGNLTKRDVEDALQQMGGDNSNVETVLAVLEDVGRRMDRNMDFDYDALTPENREAASALMERYSEFRTADPEPAPIPSENGGMPAQDAIDAELARRGLKR